MLISNEMIYVFLLHIFALVMLFDYIFSKIVT